MTRRRPTREEVPKAERIEVVRRLIIGGIPDWQIRKQLVEGLDLKDGRSFKVNVATARKYLDEIGLEYKALHDNDLVVERVIGACAERIGRIADKAEAAGNFHAAVRANVALADLIARRAPERWGRRSESDAQGGPSAPANGTRYEELDDAALLEEHKQRIARYNARVAARRDSGGR